MKPERFCSGNDGRSHAHDAAKLASMKPERFCSGNDRLIAGDLIAGHRASMKPERFCSGNTLAQAAA